MSESRVGSGPGHKPETPKPYTKRGCCWESLLHLRLRAWGLEFQGALGLRVQGHGLGYTWTLKNLPFWGSSS